MYRETHIQHIADDLRAHANEIAEIAYNQGYRKQQFGQWIRDDTYQGTAKEIYHCSNCGHWQSIKKARQHQLMYMHYCPFCGSLNAAPEENEA